jgi:hypothetical protein
LDSNYIYITDAIFLNQNNRICISTSKNELKFFSISAESIIYDFNIIGISSMPTCMDYCFDVSSFLVDHKYREITKIFYQFSTISHKAI